MGGGRERVGAATILMSLDGTGDTDNLNDALEMLPKEGGFIFIKEGTYIIKEQIVINAKDNITIAGAGRGTILKLISGAESSIGQFIDIFQINDSSNIILKDFTVKGNRAGNGGGDINVKFIDANGMENSIIENIKFEEHMDTQGISLTDNSTVGRNTIRNCSFSGGVSNALECIKITDLDCIISNNIIINPDEGGIKFSGLGRCTITGNIIVDCVGEGIDIGSSSVNDIECVVANNIITGCTTGIKVTDANTTVNGNVISECTTGIIVGSVGINNVISSNCIENNSGTGLSIAGDNTIVTGNQVRNNGDGIVITSAADRTIVTGNHCLTNTTAQITDNGSNTLPNGAKGTTNLVLDDLNIIA